MGEVLPAVNPTRRSWNRLSTEARRDVVARYQAGETSTALAVEYGVAKSTILSILRTSNAVVRRQALDATVVNEAARLYKSGLSLSQVAERLSINQETMRVAIRASGTALRPPTGRNAS